MKVAITHALTLDQKTHEKIESLGYTIDRFEAHEIYTEPTDVLVGMKMPNETLPQGLQFVQLLSAGFDQIYLDLYKAHNVKMANGRGMYSVPIAEYCLAHILSIYKCIPQYQRAQTRMAWNRLNQSRSLDGAKVLVLGTGSIAQAIAKRLHGFNAITDGINSNGRSIEPFNQTFSISELDVTLPNYDIVISTLPLNDATYHIMDKDQFLAMKKDALFLNIGRGASVNLEGLMSVLDNHLDHVILDVFETEPLDPNHPLWVHPKAVITPHASFETDNLNAYRLNIVLENLERFAKNQEIINRII